MITITNNGNINEEMLNKINKLLKREEKKNEYNRLYMQKKRENREEYNKYQRELYKKNHSKSS